MSNEHTTGRNHMAVVAHSRNSAGSMHDKRAPRQGARNSQREFLNDYAETIAIEDELSYIDDDIQSDPTLSDEEERTGVITWRFNGHVIE